MKRWLALGSGLLVLLGSLASCNTFDRRAAEGFPGAPPQFPDVVPGFGAAGIGSGFLGMAGVGGSSFFGAGSGGFAAVGAAGSGGGGWQLLDGGTPPPTPPTDDGGADDAGR